MRPGKIYYLKTNEYGEIEYFDEEDMIENIYNQLYCINERISNILMRTDYKDHYNTSYDNLISEDDIEF